MAIVQANPVDSFVELDIGSSAESFGRFLDSQKELFHSQIDQLQKLVVSQCKLTGVNPLSQEMAAGALSIKIGKKPRDLLNPKAIKYMQSVFSIKDTIGKKETREISALCGVTATQVRDFFAGQRSRVRKLVQLSREKATISDASKVSIDCCPSSSDQTLPISIQAPTNIVDPRTVEGCTLVSGNSGNLNTVQDGQQASVNPADLKTVEEGPSCSSKEETIPGVDSDDKKFLENIFNLMKKEETFSGQVKLMERILQIHNSAVLNWFLTIGGIMILATWLSQAAVEEQTTVLLVIFKVLCHLPLHKALPVQVSAILQTVNRLRFYRTSDISNRARILLSRWSKLFVRSPALKKPSFTNATKDAQKEIIRKQRISEILSDESWQSKIDIPEEILALTEGTENSRNSEPRHALKLLSASCDESNKKHGRSVSSSKIKERRKVLLVEQPDRKTAGRSMQAARAVPANNSRPLSADDIQKAKMRATFLQDKYGKIDASTGENYQQRTEDGNTSSASQTNTILPASRIPRLSKLKRDEGKKPVIPTTKTSPYKLDSKPKSTSQEPSWEKLKGNQIRWQRPPEMRTNCLWRLGAGENSKEVEVQSERIRREKETFYRSVHDVPSNPKEPWDIEMDFDDSLTPEIPTEQPADADGAVGSSCSPRDSRDKGVDAAASTSTSTSAPPPVSNGTPEPDLELLAVLLKNPDLVFALTSGQGNSLSSGETVALLDMLKETGIGLTGIIDGLVGSSKPPESTTLPSPTPSDPTTVRLPSPTPQSEPISMRLPSPTPPDPKSTGWRSEPSSLAKNPVLQPHLLGSRGSNIFPAVARSTPSPAIPLAAKNQGPGLRLPHQTPTTILSMPQLTVTVNSSSQRLPVLNFLPKKHTVPLPNQVPVSIHPSQQTLIPELHFPVTNSATVSPSSLRPETFKQRHIHDPSSFPVLPSLRHLPPTTSRPTSSTHPPTWPPNAANVAKRDLSWNGWPNGLLQVPAPDPRFAASLNNYNGYPRGSGQATLVIPGQIGGRDELLDGSELETWSPQGSPVRSPEFWSGRNFPEQRRENGRNPRPEWSRQRNSGHRDRNRTGGGGKRWRDRDRRR